VLLAVGVAAFSLGYWLKSSGVLAPRASLPEVLPERLAGLEASAVYSISEDSLDALEKFAGRRGIRIEAEEGYEVDYSSESANVTVRAFRLASEEQALDLLSVVAEEAGAEPGDVVVLGEGRAASTVGEWYFAVITEPPDDDLAMSAVEQIREGGG